VIDPEGLDPLNGVIYAVVGLVAGILLAGVLVGLILSRVGGRRVPIAICFGLSAAIASVIDVVVLSRTVSGEVTVWDVCWAIGVSGAAGSLWRLSTPRRTAS